MYPVPTRFTPKAYQTQCKIDVGQYKELCQFFVQSWCRYSGYLFHFSFRNEKDPSEEDVHAEIAEHEDGEVRYYRDTL